MTEHRTRKRFGQHFLHDRNLVDRMIRTLGLQAGDTLVEIGPGRGALTYPLLEEIPHLHVVELDRDLIARLRQEEPEISIDLVPTDRSENLLYREADIAVRMYRSEQLDVITQHLGNIQLGMFASRTYLDKHGRPETFEEMQRLDLVGYDRSDQILRGFRSMGIEAKRDWFSTRTDHQTAYLELIRQGCGIGFVQANVAGQMPELEAVLSDFSIPSLPLWLAAHEAMRQTPRIRRVWDMLYEGLKPFVS